jgi:hypothetical protein
MPQVQELDPRLQEVFNEIEMALSPLPDGYVVEAVPQDGSVIVYYKDSRVSNGIGFTVTAKEIAEGGYLDSIRGVFTDLVRAVEAYSGAQGTQTNH